MYLLFGKENCPFCVEAKSVLNNINEKYSYVNISCLDSVDDFKQAIKMITKNDKVTVPQIFKLEDGNFRYIGGCSDLKKYLKIYE